MDKMKEIAGKAVKGHEKRMHGMKKGGKVGKVGNMNMERKKVGRNMAKVMNQRGR
jgi:hypothetical protein